MARKLPAQLRKTETGRESVVGGAQEAWQAGSMQSALSPPDPLPGLAQ